ncbi:hypothetical protein CCACVL1_18545, partial [Corchorus capsularis]
MRRAESKTKSVRKPLRDLSNNYNSSVRSFSKSEIPKKKMVEKAKNQNHGSLDRLLLVQSDLSSQIDELVAEAFKLKDTSEHGRKEIESFTNVLLEMISSLKPWVPRFQKSLSSPAWETKDKSGYGLKTETVPFVNVNLNEEECFEVGSPEENTLDSLISPSPLVSWRANDCTVERGRQLFLLTPLPMSKALSSKRHDSSKSVFEQTVSKSTLELPSFLNIPKDENDDLLEGVVIEPTPMKPSDSAVPETQKTLKCGFVSSPVFPKREHSMLVMTPCLKMSPPKSCVLLEPIKESSHRGDCAMHKSTPFPVGIKNCGLSESSGSDDSEDLTMRYPELLGIQRTYKSGIGKKDLESSPTWLFSPPKSCILLEPPDEKSLDNVATDHNSPIASASNQQTEFLSKESDVIDGFQQNKSF